MKLLAIHYGIVTNFPPVISLISNLLMNHHIVTVISLNLAALPKGITEHSSFKGIEIKTLPRSYRIMDRITNARLFSKSW